MADDENSMDLNLHLGLSLLPRPQNPLGSDLTVVFPTFQRNYPPSNALHAPESLRPDLNSPTLEPNLLARRIVPDARTSDAPNSAPYAFASNGTDHPLASHPLTRRTPQRHDEARLWRLIHEMMHEIEQGRRDLEAYKKEIAQFQRNLETFEKDYLQGEGKCTKGLEKIKESAGEFGCNICLDMAREPVVTPCGHLFCWPCLYQWLHANFVFPECPVCKGEIRETDLTPIYGSGGSDTTIKKVSRDGNSELKTPPRPHARRIESLRQRSTGRIMVGENSYEPLHRRPTVQPTPTTEYASASSTADVIPGHTDILAGLNIARSSRSLRSLGRRGRSNNSGS